LILRLDDKLRQSVDNDNRPYRVSASFGLAHYDPARHASPDQLIAEADHRMYEVKRVRKTDQDSIYAH
jgi:GGDEF domain-containing protein